MEKIALFIIGILSTTSMFAQEVRTKTIDDQSEPVAYAYVTVNSQIVGVTDSLGLFLRPQNTLKVGDTVKVVFMRSVSEPFIVTDKKPKQEHTFVLPTSKIFTNTVVVRGNIYKFFRDNTKILKPINYNCQLKANLASTITGKGAPAQSVKTRLTVNNQLSSKDSRYRQYGWFHHRPTIANVPDTSRVHEILSGNIRNALHFFCQTMEIISQNDIGHNIWPRYAYDGDSNGLRRFRISYPLGKNYIVQSLLSVDVQSKNITSMALDILFCSDKQKYSQVRINYDCSEFMVKKSKSSAAIIPTKVQYTVSSSDIGIDILLSEITINEISYK